MKKQEQIIQEWIEKWREENNFTTCVFYITVPKDTDLYKDETIKKIEGILDKNHVTHGHVDTVWGAWNLNRDWVETGKMECIVEYCGVYPVNWDLSDVVELERMETNGEILILVDWVKDGEYIPNH